MAGYSDGILCASLGAITPSLKPGSSPLLYCVLSDPFSYMHFNGSTRNFVRGFHWTIPLGISLDLPLENHWEVIGKAIGVDLHFALIGGSSLIFYIIFI